MGIKWTKSRFSKIAKSNYLLSNYNYFKLRKEIDKDKSFLIKRISDYFNIVSGFAFSSKDYIENGILLCRIGDVSNTGDVVLSNMKKLPEYYSEKYKSYLIKENDILIGMTGDGKYFKIGFIESLTQNILLNQRVGILRLKEQNKKMFNPKFLYFLLKTNKAQNQFKIVAMGKTQKNISPFDILNIKIPDISLKKQNEIVEKVIPIEQEIKQLKENKKDVLYIINDVFSDYYNYDKDLWKIFGKGMTAGTQKSYQKTFKIYKTSFSQIQKSKTLRVSSRFHNPLTQKLTNILFSKPTIKSKKIIKDIIKGIQPNYNSKGDIPVIKITNLKNGFIDLENTEFVIQLFMDSLKEIQKVRKNDILLCCTGKVSLGKIDIYEYEEKLVLSVDNYIIRLDTNIYNIYFFTYFFRSILGSYQIERDYTGATNQIHLYDTQIKNFDIPNISLKEQIRIVEKINSEIEVQKNIDKQIIQKQLKISELIENLIKSAKSNY